MSYYADTVAPGAMEFGPEHRWAGAFLMLPVLLRALHRCTRRYAHFGRVDTPLGIIPTACFGAGAGLAAGLVLHGAWMRLLRNSSGPRPPDGPRTDTARTRPAGQDAG
ncbi:hypothetical protein ACFYQ5_27420 [Streptomyces sp. NPDC005794]|uniref:hypothetical protein n=1 Tax=Streptomyces sp. NPDC005794 TaxID=3364733 RepID=UPI003683B399